MSHQKFVAVVGVDSPKKIAGGVLGLDLLNSKVVNTVESCESFADFNDEFLGSMGPFVAAFCNSSAKMIESLSFRIDIDSKLNSGFQVAMKLHELGGISFEKASPVSIQMLEVNAGMMAFPQCIMVWHPGSTTIPTIIVKFFQR